jgi:hypothetical protein
MKNEARTIYLLLIAIGAVVSFIQFSPQALAASFSFYRTITVTSTASIASGTNTNFPMLVSSTLTSWESSSHGGDIQNLCTAPGGIQEPCDLVFATSSANCTAGGYLNFQTQTYSSSTGALRDWVNIPTLQTGTVIYACYDASAVNTDQSNPTSTWNSNYVGVWHLYNASDSTVNAENFTKVSTLTFGATTTPFGNGTAFNGANPDSATTTISNPFTAGQATLEMWVRANGGGTQGIWSVANGDANFYSFGGSIYEGTFRGSRLGPFTPVASTSKWAQLTIVANSSTNLWSVYQNAKLLTTSTLGTFTASSFPAGQPGFKIGQNGVANGELTGAMSELRLSQTPLTSQWITTEYNNQNAPDDAATSTGFYHIGTETAFGVIPPNLDDWLNGIVKFVGHVIFQ